MRESLNTIEKIETIKNEVGAGECCQPVAIVGLGHSQAAEMESLFAALADSTRLSILNILAQSRQEVCVCDITASFTLGQPTISHHLRILREAGLISGDKRGKWVYYSLVGSKAAEAKAMLEKVLGAPLLVG